MIKMEDNKNAKKTSSIKTPNNRTSQKSKTSISKQSKMEPKNSVPKEQRKFEKDDLIPCTSLFAGTCVLNGKRTGNTYIWEAMGEVQEVEYQDLMSEILNKRSSFIYDPLIMIGNEDVYAGRDEISKLYKHIYSEEDVVKMMSWNDTVKIKKMIRSMPKGITDSVKSMITSLIQSGRVTNYKTVKAVDDELGTEIAKQFELFN